MKPRLCIRAQHVSTPIDTRHAANTCANNNHSYGNSMWLKKPLAIMATGGPRRVPVLLTLCSFNVACCIKLHPLLSSGTYAPEETYS